jgi:hypothetical protein
MTIAGAVLLAAIAGALHWKKRLPRVVAWLLLCVGVGAAAEITSFIGFKGINIYGVGIFSVLAIIGLIVFWEEAVKKNGLHRVRTPIVAVMLGVSIMSASGALWHNLQGSLKQSTSTIDKTTVANLNK